MYLLSQHIGLRCCCEAAASNSPLASYFNSWVEDQRFPDMRGVYVCLLLANLAHGAEVYFSPPLHTFTSGSGEAALAQHFGLEYFESLSGVDFATEQPLLGSSAKNGLLVTLHEETAKGKR